VRAEPSSQRSLRGRRAGVAVAPVRQARSAIRPARAAAGTPGPYRMTSDGERGGIVFAGW